MRIGLKNKYIEALPQYRPQKISPVLDIIVILVIYILLLTLHIEMYSYINKKICNVLYYIVIFNNFGKIRLFFDFEIPCQTDRESSDKGMKMKHYLSTI